ncbi:hypothetical protein M3152_06500 [Sporosarcina luteola]|uniref:hypothetical protein n=1 Tax=Bacillales TaxID=1385 RepID=UPI00204267E1|nr:MULTISPECIES: hypothetical protein [Bacillales]MCM3637369.1 hypothetical protein [Sporosarcina luteola]
MEILIFVVLGIISMLFKGKKPEDATKTQRRQPTAQTGSPDPMRKLKEMTQEMYKDIQREFQTEIDEPPSRQSLERKPPQVISLPSEVKEVKRRDGAKTVPVHAEKHDRTSTREKTHRGRLSAHQDSVISRESVENHEMIPTSEQDLIKGIIFSEILGPPKSKQ